MRNTARTARHVRTLRGAGALASALLATLLASCRKDSSAPTGDVEARVAGVLRERNVLERNRDLAALLLSLPGASAPQVAAAYKDVFSDWGDNELVLLAEWWGPLDPNAAYSWGLEDWRARHPRFLYALMRAVARRDPQAALELYRRRPTVLASFKREYPVELEGIIAGWYESGQPGLIDFMVSQPTPELQQQTLGTFARLKVLDVGPKAALEWAEKSAAEDPSGNTARYVLQRIAGSVAEVDGPLAAEWAERQLAAGASKTLIGRVAARWVLREPEKAMRWLAKFDPADNEFRMAVDTTFRDWYHRDLRAAESWVEAQGDEGFTWLAPATAVVLRFRAARWFNDPGPSQDWAGVLEAAQKLPERDGMRWGTAAVVLGFWLKRDPAAAEAWMKSSQMPEVFQRKAYERSKNPRP